MQYPLEEDTHVDITVDVGQAPGCLDVKATQVKLVFIRKY